MGAQSERLNMDLEGQVCLRTLAEAVDRSVFEADKSYVMSDSILAKSYQARETDASMTDSLTMFFDSGMFKDGGFLAGIRP